MAQKIVFCIQITALLITISLSLVNIMSEKTYTLTQKEIEDTVDKVIMGWIEDNEPDIPASYIAVLRVRLRSRLTSERFTQNHSIES